MLYLACAWDNFYPYGGAGNVKGIYGSYDEACEALDKYREKYDWHDNYEVVQMEMGELED